MFDINDIPYDDEATWKLIQEGRTRGVFQMESPLVQHWVKKIAPQNLWELAAVVAIVRPGALKSGFADEYVAYKHGEKEFESFGHPVVDQIFNTTEHVLCYQEQLIFLGQRLAWQHLPENERDLKADDLRKAVGKKKQDKILAVGKDFVEGCIHNSVDQAVAERLFEIIKNSGRYLFNLSHAFKYGKTGYETAYLKANYPLPFFATYLTFNKFKAVNKWESFKDLVSDAKAHNIDILPPNINKRNVAFAIEGNKIRYGLGTIKYFGKHIQQKVKGLPDITDWRQVLVLGFTKEYGIKANSRIMEALIYSGALSDVQNISRSGLLEMYKFFKDLTAREQEFILKEIADLPGTNPQGEFDYVVQRCMEEICNKGRRERVADQYKLCEIDRKDHPAFIEDAENNYLHVALTGSILDTKDVQGESDSCIADCLDESINFMTQSRAVAAIIDEVRITTTKNGKNPGQVMAIISIHDSSGSLNKIPVFPDQFKDFQTLLIEKNTVLVYLQKGNRGWIVNSMAQI